MKFKKKKLIIKDQFGPDLTDLNITLKEAYKEVIKKQKELSVEVQNLLVRDINIINEHLLHKDAGTNKSIELYSEQSEIRNNIEFLTKKFNIVTESKAARILAVHRVLTNKGFRSPGISEDSLPRTNEEYFFLV